VIRNVVQTPMNVNDICKRVSAHGLCVDTRMVLGLIYNCSLQHVNFGSFIPPLIDKLPVDSTALGVVTRGVPHGPLFNVFRTAIVKYTVENPKDFGSNEERLGSLKQFVMSITNAYRNHKIDLEKFRVTLRLVYVPEHYLKIMELARRYVVTHCVRDHSVVNFEHKCDFKEKEGDLIIDC